MVVVNLIPKVAARIILNECITTKKGRPISATTNDIPAVGCWSAIDLYILALHLDKRSSVEYIRFRLLCSINTITGRDCQPDQLRSGQIAWRIVVYLIFLA